MCIADCYRGTIHAKEDFRALLEIHFDVGRQVGFIPGATR